MAIIKLSKETKEYIRIQRSSLEQLGVLEESDEKNLDLLASQYELYIRAMADMDERGFSITDSKGKTTANPAFAVARSCMAQITSLLKELSLSCRQRRLLAQSGQSYEPDPMDDFLEQLNFNHNK